MDKGTGYGAPGMSDMLSAIKHRGKACVAWLLAG
jgi:hypothetical protein